MITAMKLNPTLRVGIVADDLTSATDGAGPFLAKGHAPLIASRATGPDARTVVSIDTNSRALAPEAAATATTKAVAALSGRDLLFKTIDSTLRGHVQVEIAAALPASSRRRLVVAPAFPDAGRVTIGGVQLVHGVPVSDSDYGRDPVHPARTSKISDLLDPSLGAPLILAPDSPDEVAARAASAGVVILDARSQAELNRQAARIPDPGGALWVGSPGLAIALAALVPAAPSDPGEADAIGLRVLVVVGSANPVSHAQADALEAGPALVVSDLTSAPAAARIVCLRAPRGRQTDPGEVLAALADQAAAAIARRDFDVVIATGGETIAAILERLGVSSFTLVKELEPGFPVGRAERAGEKPLILAMKAGGFGGPQTLVRAANVLLGDPAEGKATIHVKG